MGDGRTRNTARQSRPPLLGPNQALHIEAYTGPSRLHRVLDWVGNQWDKLNELGKICAVVCGVAVCFAAAVAAVEAMT